MTREYDDGYDSRESFERADEDTWEQVCREEGMSEDDYIHAAWEMERIGGGFAARIAQAYYVADKDNKQRLRAASRGLFARYHREGESK